MEQSHAEKKEIKLLHTEWRLSDEMVWWLGCRWHFWSGTVVSWSIWFKTSIAMYIWTLKNLAHLQAHFPANRTQCWIAYVLYDQKCRVKMPLMKNLILVCCLKREKEVFHVIANCAHIFFKLHFAYVIQSVAQMSKLAIAYMHSVVVGNKFSTYAYQPIFYLHLCKLHLFQWYFNATWGSMFAHRVHRSSFYSFACVPTCASCTSYMWQFLKHRLRFSTLEFYKMRTNLSTQMPYQMSFALVRSNLTQSSRTRREKKICIEHDANTPFLALAPKSLL